MCFNQSGGGAKCEWSRRNNHLAIPKPMSYVGSNAILSGFTLTGGRTFSSGDINGDGAAAEFGVSQ